MRRKQWSIALLALLIVMGVKTATPAFAAGSCVPTVCNYTSTPACSAKTASVKWRGIDDCGQKCSKTVTCGTCSAPKPACGQITTGVYSHSGVLCTRKGSACPKPKVSSSPFVSYGVALPGDPIYGFPLAPAGGPAVLPDNLTRDLVGFAAKGNIVIGDYTTPTFAGKVLPHLRSQSVATPKTQAYAIDPTDANLGYHNNGYDAQNRPEFDGNYDQQDGYAGVPGTGTKLDNTPRKFYESTLPDSQFQQLIQSNLQNSTGKLVIDSVLFTNHAFAGHVPIPMTVNGTIVARDDALIYSNSLAINHDVRLTQGQLAQQVVLPMSIQRPKLTSWVDCGVVCP